MPKPTSDCCATGCKRLWPKVMLGDVCEVKAGRDYKDVESLDGKYPIYGTGGVMGMSREWRCPAGSVIVGRKGTLDNPMLINEPFWNIDTCFGVVPSDKLLPAYLWRFCQNFDFYSLVPASGRPSTTSDAVKAIKLPLPPLAEQKKIVEKVEKALKRVDVLKAQFERMEKSAADYFKAFLTQAFDFADPTMVELSWDEVFNTRTGKLDSNAAVIGGQYPFFTCSKEVLQIDDFAFDCEALLLAGNNAVGKYDVKHFVGKFNAYQRTYVLTLKNAEWSYPVFKAQLEKSLTYLKDSSKGTATKYLTMGILRKLKFAVPSTERQVVIAQQFDAAKLKSERMVMAARRGIEICGKMRKAILAEAFQ